MNNYYEEIEIIENVKVRKLQRRKVITVNISGPLGINVQLIPKLGVGVNIVNSTSTVFDKIHRGDIICEFNGQKLHDINHVKDFVEMTKQCDGNERQFVIEYTMWNDTAQTAKEKNKHEFPASIGDNNKESDMIQHHTQSDRMDEGCLLEAATAAAVSAQKNMVSKPVEKSVELNQIVQSTTTTTTTITEKSTKIRKPFECAKAFGLPDGWMVRIQSRSRYTFRSPEGKLFYSKKQVFEYLGISQESSDKPKSAQSIPKKQPQITVQNEKNAHESSLSDIIEKLNRSKQEVERFGTIPWKGCKLLTAPPAPITLGLEIQSIPSRFGVGVHQVLDSSPLHGQIHRGDIITHFMDMPLFGLDLQECVRMFRSQDEKIERIFHIAPSDFEFDIDQESTLGQKNNETNISGMMTPSPQSLALRSPTKATNSERNSYNAQSIPLQSPAKETDTVGSNLTGQSIALQSPAKATDAESSSPIAQSIALQSPAKATDDESSSPIAQSIQLQSPAKATEDERSKSNTQSITLQSPAKATDDKRSNSNTQSITLQSPAKATEDERSNSNTQSITLQSPAKPTDDERSRSNTQSIPLQSPSKITDFTRSNTTNVSNIIMTSASNQAVTSQCPSTLPGKDKRELPSVASEIHATESKESYLEWKKEEDDIIRRLIEERGTEDWERIAIDVPMRNASQCRFRWINRIEPSVILGEEIIYSSKEPRNKTIVDTQPLCQTVKVISVDTFEQEEIAKMPVCYAFNPGDEESRRKAELKQRRLNDDHSEMKKKQKISN